MGFDSFISRNRGSSYAWRLLSPRHHVHQPCIIFGLVVMHPYSFFPLLPSFLLVPSKRNWWCMAEADGDSFLPCPTTCYFVCASTCPSQNAANNTREWHSWRRMGSSWEKAAGGAAFMYVWWWWSLLHNGESRPPRPPRRRCLLGIV